MPDAKYGETVGAAVVARSAGRRGRAARALRRAPGRLQGARARSTSLDAIPKGPTGKVQRRLLAEQLAVKVAVLGAGAIGAYVGAALARGGADVRLIARGAHLAAMREQRRARCSARAATSTRTRRRPTTRAEIGPVDVVFLGLKAYSYASAGPLLAPLLHDDTAVVAAQNGIPWWYFHRHGGPYDGRRIEAVDPGGATSAAIAPERAIGCVVYCSTELEAPGVVRHVEGTRFSIGEPDGSRLRALPRVLRGDRRRRPQVPGRDRPPRRASGSS